MRKVGQVRGAALRTMAGVLASGGLWAAAGSGAVVALAVSTAPAAASDAKQQSISAEFGKAAAPIQKVLQDVQPLLKKYSAASADAKPAALAEWKAALVAANAPAQLAAAEAGIKIPFDRYIAGMWGSQIAQVMNDNKLFQHALQNVIDSGMGTPQERLVSQSNLATLAYQNGDYAAAVKAATPLVSGNVADDQVPVVLAASYSKLGQNEQALAVLKSALDARKAAGGVVPQRWYSVATQIAGTAKLAPQGTEWAVATAASNPTPENLLVAETLIRYYNEYDNPATIDCVRLAWRSGAMAVKSDISAQEYKVFLNAADPRRYPGEVLAVVDAGIANGSLDPHATFVAEPRATASKLVAADRASLNAFYKDAQAPQASGKLVVGAADALLSYGENAKAAELYQLALAKPGIETDVVLNHLGMAQVGVGDYAGAQATLAKVQGKRKPLAQLWSLYAQSKAAGK